jgi:hypothetical protein
LLAFYFNSLSDFSGSGFNPKNIEKNFQIKGSFKITYIIFWTHSQTIHPLFINP